MPVSKATKKFEKKHLKGVLEKRKETAKIKQRAQVKAKKQTKRTQDAEFYKGGAEGKDGAAPSKFVKRRPDAKVSDMSVDDFFKGGFEIIDKDTKTTANKDAGGKAAADDTHLGKRKRNGVANYDSESDAVASESDGDLDDDDVGMTKEAMDALAKNDPEFYAFLKENDPKALDFDDNAGFDGLGDGDDDEADDGEDRPVKKQKKAGKKGGDDDDDDDDDAAPTVDNELTLAMVAQWEKLMKETYSQRAARQTVMAFSCAVHLNEDDGEKVGGATERYTIKSPDVFHSIVVAALTQIPKVVEHHVPVQESATTGKVNVPTGSKKFKTMSLLVKSFTASVLHLLATLTDDATLRLTLSSLEPLLPFLLSFRKQLKNLVKTVVSIWSQPSSIESTRITAFLVMRRLMVIGDKGVRELVLKTTYQGLAEGCRATNANTIGGVNLMKNSAAELWGLDIPMGYTTAFTSIRQLAIHLRNSIVHNQSSAFRTVYNWQYMHSLDFWSVVLSQHCNEATKGAENQLSMLVYPLVQVTLGTMRLIPTAAYFPLRFHLYRSLLRLSRATGTFIPLASEMLQVLNSAEMKKPAKAGMANEPDFSISYKASKSLLHTAVYQTAVGEQVVELLAEFFAVWSTNIAFPDFSLPVIIMLKRWIKEARKRGGAKGGRGQNNKVIAALTVLVQKLESNARFIEEKRAMVDFAPKDRTQMDNFLKDYDWEKTPIGAYVTTQRKLNADRQRLQEAARKEEDKKRAEEKKEKQEARKQEFDADEFDDEESSEEEGFDDVGDEDEEMDGEENDEDDDESEEDDE